MRDSIPLRYAPSSCNVVLFRQLWRMHAVCFEHRNLAGLIILIIMGLGEFSIEGEDAFYFSLSRCQAKIWSIVTDKD
jgi:hypothetical protein